MAAASPYLMSSNMPLATNILIARNIVTRYGMIITATPNPSFAPVTNDSYIGTRLYAADSMTNMIKAGIAHWLTDSINAVIACNRSDNVIGAFLLHLPL